MICSIAVPDFRDRVNNVLLAGEGLTYAADECLPDQSKIIRRGQQFHAPEPSGYTLGARDRGISLEARGRGALVVHMHEGHDTTVFVVCGGSIANLVIDKSRSRGDK